MSLNDRIGEILELTKESLKDKDDDYIKDLQQLFLNNNTQDAYKEAAESHDVFNVMDTILEIVTRVGWLGNEITRRGLGSSGSNSQNGETSESSTSQDNNEFNESEKWITQSSDRSLNSVQSQTFQFNKRSSNNHDFFRSI